jgi:putative ABC transport system ATP-binding protein
MGPSGSGKTTLLEILGCLSQPSGGTYRFGGTPLGDFGETDLARLRGRDIGFIFQAFNLLPRLSLAENVQLPLVYQRVPRAERRARALEALARVGLEHRARHRPSHVSGGERQRAAIARALVTRPTLLLGDEPTGNLDSDTGRGILELLTAIHGEGATVVVVTHDASIAERAGRKLRIRDGRIEADTGGAA